MYCVLVLLMAIDVVVVVGLVPSGLPPPLLFYPKGVRLQGR
jgi:hypothetical protein